MTEATAITEQGDVLGSSLMHAIPDPLARDTRHFLVEYGVRIDDSAIVFHFFSPKDGDWNPAFHQHLEKALQLLPTTSMTAGYAPEVDSFYVIVGGLGASPDPWPTIEKFFSELVSLLDRS